MLLVDTDAFCKLGITGLLQSVVAMFGAELQECGRLPALPYMLRKGRLRAQYGGGACDSLIPLAEAMPVIEQPAGFWLEKLTHITGIDPGEAQLFALAAESGLILISGDKRALQALKNVVDFADPLSGRIVVLEALLLTLCDQLGDEEMRRRLAPLAEMDTMVKVCFSDGNHDPRQGLLSYYETFAADVAPLVLWNPRHRDQA